MSEKLKCGICLNDINFGAQVCEFCQSTVVYGATSRELNEGFRNGLVLGTLISAVLFMFGPIFLNDLFKTEWFPNFFGMGFYAFLVALVIGAICAFKAQSLVSTAHEGQIRFYHY